MPDGNDCIDPDEFRETGFLYEVNRRFFHPLGLAMAVSTDDDGTATFQVFDDRGDPEGWVFSWAKYPDVDQAKAEAVEKAARVQAEWDSHATVRMERFGWVVQPVGVEADANGS